MDNTSTIYLPTTRRESLPIAEIRCTPGKVAVLMDDERGAEGTILLPDVVQGRLRPDSGIVAGVGAGRQFQKYKDDLPHIEVGDRVLVRPYSGLWEEELWPGYQVRFYGLARAHGSSQATDWADDIVAFESEGEWWPTGSNVFVRRDKDTRALVQIEAWLDSGEIVARGPLASDDVRVGRRVTFSPGLQDDLMNFAFGGDPDVWMVPGYCLTMVIE